MLKMIKAAVLLALRSRCAFVLSACLTMCQFARAEVHLQKIFSSRMVLQQQKPIVVWGWDKPNQTVTVQIGFEFQTVQANQGGEWKAVLPAKLAAGPYRMTVSGSSTVSFDNVLIGEVWLCFRPSNMEMGVGAAQSATQEVAAANYPNVL